MWQKRCDTCWREGLYDSMAEKRKIQNYHVSGNSALTFNHTDTFLLRSIALVRRRRN